jgi:hypothetical protein
MAAASGQRGILFRKIAMMCVFSRNWWGNLGIGSTLLAATWSLATVRGDDPAAVAVAPGTDDLRLGVPTAPQQPTVTAPRSRTAKKLEVIRPEVAPDVSVHEVWNRHFAAHQEPTANVRETCRTLMRQQKYDEVVAMLHAALLHGQMQPWMYEAIGIALVAKGAEPDEIERTLMSAVDLSEDAEFILLAADYLSRMGFDRRALQLVQDVSRVYPARPEPYMQGLAAAQRMNDRAGIAWACAGILSLAWPKEHQHIETKAYRIAAALLEEVKAEKNAEELAALEKQFTEALARDCIVKITWTGDADIDMQVLEPSGEVCSLQNIRTSGGGVLLGDAYSGSGEKPIEGVSEYYVCPQGFAGEYKVLLRRVWGKVTAGKVTVDVYTNFRTPEQIHIRRQIPLGENGAMVLFQLDHGRRIEALPAQQIAQVARTQTALSRALLAQQLASYDSSDATVDYLRDALQASRDGRLPRRGVGTRPVITVLPEGTNFNASAVISADRRYVRVTPMPLFSGIGNVDTFTFNGGTGQQGGGGGGGVLGGGGGGGGILGGGGGGGGILGGGRR